MIQYAQLTGIDSGQESIYSERLVFVIIKYDLSVVNTGRTPVRLSLSVYTNRENMTNEIKNKLCTRMVLMIQSNKYAQIESKKESKIIEINAMHEGRKKEWVSV